MSGICSCSRPITDEGFLCYPCTETLRRNLGDVPALEDELETTRTRQSKTGGPGIGIVVRDSERPVPWNERASRAIGDLRVRLHGWVRLCQDFRIRPEGPECASCVHPTCVYLRSLAAPDDTLAGMSRYLLASVSALRHRPEVTECADDIDAAVRGVEKVIDRKPEQVFYGPCGSVEYIDGEPDPNCEPCPADLYGQAEATDLTCEACATPHKVEDIRRHLMDAAQDRLATAAELSRFLTHFGQVDTSKPLTAERIRKWASRRTEDSPPVLLAHAQDKDGRPLYRVGDVVKLLTEGAQRERRGRVA